MLTGIYKLLKINIFMVLFIPTGIIGIVFALLFWDNEYIKMYNTIYDYFWKHL